jgi:hypothetical protein
LVYKLERINQNEFENIQWDLRKLKNYTGGRSSAIPFSISLVDLMEAAVSK